MREEQPQGTGGALRDARRHLAESFLLLYGDSLLPIHYAAAGARLKDSAALGVIVVYRDPSGETAVRPNVALDRSGLVTRYDKTAAAGPALEYVEAGVSCFRREVLDLLPGDVPRVLRAVRLSAPHRAPPTGGLPHLAAFLRHWNTGALAGYRRVSPRAIRAVWQRHRP